MTIGFDATEGKLTAVVAYDDGETTVPVFTNTYSASTVKAHLRAQKELKYTDGENDTEVFYPFEAGAYSFRLAAGSNTAGVETPMPEKDTAKNQTGHTAAGAAQTAEIVFDNIEFTKPGEYTYTIHEIIPDDAQAQIGSVTVKYADATEAQQGTYSWEKDGVIYTNTTHTAVVHVTDNKDGTMTPSVTYTANGETDEPTFTNTYTTDTTELVLGGSKKVTDVLGGTRSAAGYSFALYRIDRQTGEDHDGTGETRTKLYDTGITSGTGTTGDKVGTFTFTGLTYTQADIGKTFIYEIEEIPSSSREDIRYDSCVYRITVEIDHDGKGKLTKTVSCTKDGEAADIDEILFGNVYDPACTATLQATKELAGRDWTESDAFSFVMTAMTDGAPMPGSGGDTATAVADRRTASFGQITFKLADAGKTYVYQLREVIPTNAVTTIDGKTVTYSEATQEQQQDSSLVWRVRSTNGPLVQRIRYAWR